MKTPDMNPSPLIGRLTANLLISTKKRELRVALVTSTQPKRHHLKAHYVFAVDRGIICDQ